MQRLPLKPDLTPLRLFNPSLEPFTFIYDKQEYKIAGYGVASFPAYIANRMARSLADYIISRGGVRKNYFLDKEELLKEIFGKK